MCVDLSRPGPSKIMSELAVGYVDVSNLVCCLSKPCPGAGLSGLAVGYVDVANLSPDEVPLEWDMRV